MLHGVVNCIAWQDFVHWRFWAVWLGRLIPSVTASCYVKIRIYVSQEADKKALNAFYWNLGLSVNRDRGRSHVTPFLAVFSDVPRQSRVDRRTTSRPDSRCSVRGDTPSYIENEVLSYHLTIAIATRDLLAPNPAASMATWQPNPSYRPPPSSQKGQSRSSSLGP